MLKLQNIYPFTKSQGLDECFLPFITYVHRQCDLHLFLVSVQIKPQLRLHLLHTGIYQNPWGAEIHVRRMLSYTTFTIQMLFAVFFALCTTLQKKIWMERKVKNGWSSAEPVNQFPDCVVIYILHVFLLRDTGSETLHNKANTSVLNTSRCFLNVLYLIEALKGAICKNFIQNFPKMISRRRENHRFVFTLLQRSRPLAVKLTELTSYSWQQLAIHLAYSYILHLKVQIFLIHILYFFCIV